jgi:hypothetical protein
MRDWDRIWPAGLLGTVVLVAIIDVVTQAVDWQWEGVMNKWRDFRRDMATELFLLAYMIAWGGVLLVTYMLTK